MKKRFLAILLVFIMLFTQISFLQSSTSIFDSGKNDIKREATPTQTFLDINAPYGGVENIKANRLSDPGFEEVGPGNTPNEFSFWGSSSIIVDSEYQTEVYAGTYGAYMSVEGTEQFSAYATNSRSLGYEPELSYMDQQIELEFWYNCKANPDIGSTAQTTMYLQVMTDIGNIYMHYYFSSNTFPGANSTYYGYFDIRGSLNSWIQVDRNITQDFIEAFPARDISVSYIRNMYFTCQSITNPTGPVVLLFDEVELTNGTAFNYLANNGDFEDGDSSRWTTTRSDPGSVYLSDSDYTQGSRSMNITTYSQTSSAYSEAYADYPLYNGWQTTPKGLFAQQPGELVIDFDWKYSDTMSGGDEYSYFYFSFANATYSGTLFYFLGHDSDTLGGFVNHTQPTYINNFRKADGFNVKDTWHHLTIDYYDVLQSFGLINMAFHYVGFYTVSSGPNAKVQVLVDEFYVVSYPAGDPSFENNFEWYSYDPVIAWMTPYDDDYVNITTDAYSGNYATNLTSHSGNTNVYCRRNMHLPVVNNLYTDFMWRLDKLTDTAQWAYSVITLRLDSGSNSVNYIIGENSYVTLSNSSNTCYYYADGYNQIGVWTNLFRNVSNDVYSYYGVDNWNVTQIDLRSYAGNPDVASALFDDLHFVRDSEGPTITNPAINPIVPEYGETVDVTVDVVDSTEIIQVELISKIGTGSWVSDIMTPSGDEYSATLPAADYGVTVEYYFIAEDIYGNFAQLGSSGSPYSYIVDDTVNPVLVVEAPSESLTLTGTIQFNFTDAYDLGSGIAEFLIIIDGITEYSGMTVPATYLWDTELYGNVDYPVVFRLEDNAGNFVQIAYLYTINNPIPSPTPTDTGSLFGGILGVSIVSSLSFIYITFVRRKRRV